MDAFSKPHVGEAVAVRSARDIDVEAIPAFLREMPVWLCWKLATHNGKPTKVPVSPQTGRRIDATALGLCCSLEQSM